MKCRGELLRHLHILFIFIPDDRKLFYPFSDFSVFQRKNHIRCSFKESDVTFPAYAALAILQADKLLLHFSPAGRAGFIALSHIIAPDLAQLTGLSAKCKAVKLHHVHSLASMPYQSVDLPDLP